MQVLKQNNKNVPGEIRVKLMNKYLEILKNLKIFNDKILQLKNRITETLKKYSFSSLNDLINKINEKQTSTEIKHQKLTHVKNAFSLIKNIFERKNLIKETKEKIIENIKQVTLAKEDFKERKQNEIKEEKEIELEEIIHKIKENDSKLQKIKKAKDQIKGTKKTLIDLASIKMKEKMLKEEKIILQSKLEEIRQEKLKEEKKKKTEDLREVRNQFFLQKIDEIKQVQNRTDIRTKLIQMHHDLVNKLVNTLLYLNQLKETHIQIKEHKENLIILEKIKQAKGIILEMKRVINNTKRIIEDQNDNIAIQEGYDSTYNQLIEKVESLKIDLKNAETGESISKIREKIGKLTNLYKILKTGSAHNALRNELMKKLVNINSSILQGVNIFKLQNEINLLK